MTPTVFVGWVIRSPTTKNEYRRKSEGRERHGDGGDHVLAGWSGDAEQIRDDVAPKARNDRGETQYQQPECSEGFHRQLASTL